LFFGQTVFCKGAFQFEEENHTCKASDAGKIKDWKHYGLILASATYREGVRGLYKGVNAQWMRVGPLTMIQFMVWEQFRVYFKIFSYNHTKWPKRRSGSGIKRSLGCKRSEAPLNIAGVIEIKPGFLGDEAAFENKCLLWSTLICHFANEAFQSSKEGSIFEKLTHLWTKRSTQKNKKDAGKLLKQEIEKLISQLDLPVNGPYNIIETLPKLCHHFSSQINVIRSTQEPEANVESFPSSVWDDTLPQIFLYLSEPGHVVPIINLKKYVNKNNQLCLICRKTFTPFYRHVCSFKEKSCFLCNCYYAKENTIIQKNLPFQYCFSKLDLHLPNFIVCNICNYKFPTQRCFDSHKVICGVK
jgi:hypothetical protein